MDRVTEMRALIKQTMTEWAEFLGAPPGIENVLVFDEKSDNYIWIYTGWENGEHVNHNRRAYRDSRRQTPRLPRWSGRGHRARFAQSRNPRKRDGYRMASAAPTAIHAVRARLM